MLTRIRNASCARHTEVVVPASRTKRAIARILKDEGFIADFTEEQQGPGHFCDSSSATSTARSPVVSGLKRDQQARAAGLRREDRYPARARRPRHRHRQHQPGDHDRPAGPQGPARRRSPGVRLLGRDVSNRTPAHPGPGRGRYHHRRQPCRGQGAQGQLSRDLHPEMGVARGRRPARRERPTHLKRTRAARPDPDARQQHGRRA